MSSGKHRVRLTIGDGRLGAQVELIHPETCTNLDEDGNCLLTDWVEEVGEELFADEITFEVPVFVVWPFEDEGPELYFEAPPDTREER